MFDITAPIYTDAEKAREHLEAIHWPNGPSCPHCGNIDGTRIVKLQGKSTRPGVYKCNECRSPFSVTVGTVFERSHIPLNKWVLASHLMAASKKGMSAHQLHRMLGVTYKTAWRMFKQIRALMDEDNGPLSGEVEVDETWIGGKLGNNNKYRNGVSPFANKTAVVGAVERGGKVATKVVKNVRRAEIMPLVAEKVMPEATVFTDEARSYDGLGNRGYQHHRVNHSARVYVTGNVHTNTIEGFWSLFKNSIRGTHHAVGAAYLQSYLNEYTFRYNRRNDPMPMFRAIQGRVSQVRAGRYGEYAPLR